jgi:hypothetical protein
MQETKEKIDSPRWIERTVHGKDSKHCLPPAETSLSANTLVQDLTSTVTQLNVEGSPRFGVFRFITVIKKTLFGKIPGSYGDE